MKNQEYALAEFRHLMSINDPPPYTVRWIEEVRNACIWVSIAGDVDWYDVRIDGDCIASAKRGSTWFGPDASKYIGAKQAKKIMVVLKQFWAENAELTKQLIEPSERKWADMLEAMTPIERETALNPVQQHSPSFPCPLAGENISFHEAVEKLMQV